MNMLSRRQFLASASAATIVGAAGSTRLSGLMPAQAAEPPAFALRVVSRVIEVNGKAAKAYGLEQPDGTAGIITKSDRFRLSLRNEIDAPTLIHWHGLLPPYGQDGVPGLPQPLLQPGQAYEYDFPLKTPGTHWMHAHTLQEQQLMAAPLIVTDAEEAARDEQPVIVLLHDFSFTSPEELLAGLRSQRNKGASMDDSAMPGMDGMNGMPGMESMSSSAGPGMTASAGMDINDIDYDAYLANDRTLDDPQVFQIEPNGVVRLRLINGATATAFWIDLGELLGTVIAVDGNPVHSVRGRRFPLAMGQRIDIRINVPHAQGAWPILALREGSVERTGFILATKSGRIRQIAKTGDKPAKLLDLVFEKALQATNRPDNRHPARSERLILAGDMMAYTWSFGRRVGGPSEPLPVRPRDRVEVTMANQSMMGHPMHLHGHHFQVVAIDKQRIQGAVRDTVWVPPMREVTIAFDADNPGTWAFHCHHLYHMASGMMTTVKYET